MQQLIIGRYIPGQSVIHKLDPRTKLLIVFLYVFVVFLANNAISYGFFFLHFSCIFLQIKKGKYYSSLVGFRYMKKD